MSLSDLPREILVEISHYLDNVAMNALGSTNSQVYDILISYLYRQDLAKPDSKSLIWAAKLGVESTIQRAIYARRYCNPIPESFHTALQIAASQGHVHLVELLLKVDGIDLNFNRGSSSKLKATPLGLAARKGYSSVVELLLAADGVDPNVEDAYSLTPLYWACERGHVSIVRQLLSRDDVHLNAIGSRRPTTPLIVACTNSHVTIIKLLLAKDGIDVNFRRHSNGDTPLIIAINKKLVGAVKSLLLRGDLEPNILNNIGHHVLVIAAAQGHLGILKRLLDHPDIDPNFAARGGSTALMEAVEPDVAKVLLNQEGIEINRQDHAGMTALCLAALRNNLEVAKLLLEREDININLPSNNGSTPLSLACRSGILHGSSELVGLLLRKDDIDPNIKDIHSGLTPLGQICEFDRVYDAMPIVRLLLSHPKTDLNIVDNLGFSILARYRRRLEYLTWSADYGLPIITV